MITTTMPGITIATSRKGPRGPEARYETRITGEHAYNGVIVQESFTGHDSEQEASDYHLAAVMALSQSKPLASTQGPEDTKSGEPSGSR